MNTKHLFNATTSLFILVIAIHNPLSVHIHLWLSVVFFSIAAAINHIFPRKLYQLTHVVKSFFTQVLFASIGEYILIGFLVSFIDLFPLYFKNKASKYFEFIGFLGRIFALSVGVIHANYGWILVIVMGLLSIPYYLERKERIARGQRWDYNISHSFEHFMIFIYIFWINFDCINLQQTSINIFIFSIMLFLIPTVLGIHVNQYLFKKNFSIRFAKDRTVNKLYKRKIISNLKSNKLYNYMQKLYNKRLDNSMVEWPDIEKIIKEIEVTREFDLAIGIFSGGGFIAPLVAEHNKIEEVDFIHIKRWSSHSLLEVLCKIIQYYIWRKNRKMRYQDKAYHDICMTYSKKIKNKHILLIDDSTSSGGTMYLVKRYLLSFEPASIATFSLFVHPNHRTDYYYKATPVPIIWPWGYEVD